MSHQAGEEFVLRTLAEEVRRLKFSRLTYRGILAASRLAKGRPRLHRQSRPRAGTSSGCSRSQDHDPGRAGAGNRGAGLRRRPRRQRRQAPVRLA